ncbi:MAG: DMT family transporter [Verrucomicrobia bacterium]|nr:DMT family transporter [Verrucomicrobiota bacterium]MBU6446497.1 DMT family transporter [Verrucomicrobiota bacterium]MDE3047448.1 DMT family transporter [Verrucomicrobiota bacterium]
MSIWLVILMYAGWSSMFSLGKMALEHSPPLFLTASRMLLAGVILLGFLAFKNRGAFKLTGKQWLSIVFLALFSIYLTNAFEFWSLQHMTAAKTCFIYSLSPFFAALFSYWHFGEKATPRKWLGMAIGVAGIIPVLMIQKGADQLFCYLSWPELAMVGASICTVYGWVLLRLVVKDSTISPLTANGLSMFIGGCFALLHSYLVEPWNPLPVASSAFPSFAQGLLIMTLISNIICYNIYGMMLKRYTATFLSFMGVLSPIFASLCSWFFLGEPISPVIFLSTGIVSLGLWLIYSAELRQGYIAKNANEEALTTR